MLTIDIKTARRFILGKQGLWPGRRWRGIEGTVQAMRDMEYLQLDPLQIIARSHDIALYGRILDYTPGQWEEVTYQQRKFFDWGGWLATRPMEEVVFLAPLDPVSARGRAKILFNFDYVWEVYKHIHRSRLLVRRCGSGQR